MFGRRQQTASKKNKQSQQNQLIETLESRQLMSANLPAAAPAHVPHLGRGTVVPAHVSHLGRGVSPAPKPAPAPAPAPAPVTGPVFDNIALTLSHSALFGGGTALVIDGSTGNEQIGITEATGMTGNVYTISNGSWSTTVTDACREIIVKGDGGTDMITLAASVTTNALIYGGAGNDTITGGSGNDRIYDGAGKNLINGGAGDDTIVTLGAAGDTLTGGTGNDSFWINGSSSADVITDLTESAMNVHRVGSFMGFTSSSGRTTTTTPVSTTLGGQTLLESALTGSGISYSNAFSTNPLFGANGPVENDIQQGEVGDCYFLSTLASIAKIDPARIQQSVVDLGDGTYAVQFQKNGVNVFVRVDSKLPVMTGTSYLAYANTGSGGAMWAAVIEKAFTEFRYSNTAASYSNIDSGWMDEAYHAMGVANTTNIDTFSSANAMMNQILNLLNQGKSVTMAVNQAPAGSNLVSDHAYTVDHISYDSHGNMQLVVRNPWGVDGYTSTDGNNDGYVTVTAAQAYAACWGITAATV